MKSEKQFSYLTSEAFLALPQGERVLYLQSVTDHLNSHAALLTEPQPLPEKKS